MYNKKLEDYFDKYYDGVSSDTIRFIIITTMSDELYRERNRYGYHLDTLYVCIQLVFIIIGVILSLVFKLDIMVFVNIIIWLILGLTIYNNRNMKKLADSQNELLSDIYAILDRYNFVKRVVVNEKVNKSIGIKDADDMEYILGDIVYNEISDDYWVVQEVSEIDKSLFNVNTKYCLARFNNKSRGCVALKDNMNYRIVLRPGELEYKETIEEFNKYI